MTCCPARATATRERAELARVDDGVARRERRRLRGGERCGSRGALARVPGPELGEHSDRDDDRRSGARARRAPSGAAARRRRAAGAVQPAEPEQRHEERRLDDQRPPVRRRPDLVHGRQLRERAPEPRQPEHASRRRALRSRSAARQPRARRRRRVARGSDVDERKETAEPDGRCGEDVREVDDRCEHARLVAVERVT